MRQGVSNALVLLVDARNLRTGTGYDAGTGRLLILLALTY